MRIYLMLVLCLAGAACGRSVQEVENLLETLREALETVDGASELGRRAEGETETVKVSENGVVFAETISFDDEHNCETLHVPAHNGRAEVDIRHCFKDKEGKTGTSMYCYTKDSKCFLLRVEDEGEPGGLEEQEAGIKQFKGQNDPVLDADGIEVHENRWVVTGAAERSVLPEVLASFKPDFPVFFADHLDEDAEILSDDGGDETGEDDKRQLPGCRYGGSYQQKYVVYSPAGCEYLVSCARDAHGNSQCPRRHVTDTVFMTCLCCPEATTKQQCHFCQNL
ncbi:PREDICTED: uncharacterized protein LOC109480602 [Branchiostoma belcheri]|uniref:Uncharacterized protein LOC109480602 n=1 Tax=Branchiostoma belcheri TaxID=7741 RepID=A0A6P4ZAJ9_BRABE|nr:PREDICTED: uncharacterized protein LOC109480602 [Branchiostoma belcheri]XP_019638396.1 PREDICTED: uncharacterized protein LOC109480602 [Branchiostoma belcheri]